MDSLTYKIKKAMPRLKLWTIPTVIKMPLQGPIEYLRPTHTLDVILAFGGTRSRSQATLSQALAKVLQRAE